MVRDRGLNIKLFIVVIFLLLVGAIAIYSSSAILSAEVYGYSYYFFIKHLVYLFSGLIIMLFIISSKSEFYKTQGFVYGLLIFSIALLMLTLNAPIINGTQRWIRFGGFSFQPSELAKLSVILYLSYYFSQKREIVFKGGSGFLIPGIFVGIIIILIVKQPDIGTASMIVIISGMILFAGGIRIKYILYLISFSLLFLISTILLYDYAIKRVVAMFDYNSDPLGKGFQIVQSLIALGSGGFSGVGLGDSTQKLYYLPYAHTDFIFSVIGEEIGFIATFLIVLAFLVFFIEGMRIARNSKNQQNMLMALGITTWIIIQALINVSVVIGIFPPKGIPLPFVSYGGSSLVVMLFAVGILIKISMGKTR
jgi:cell division protein FtsW